MKRGGYEYPIYFDPGAPPQFLNSDKVLNIEYFWNHSFVSIWGSHLDPNDGVLWDISPNSIGNQNINYSNLEIETLNKKYNRDNGGDNSSGYKLNPITKLPYEKLNCLLKNM